MTIAWAFRFPAAAEDALAMFDPVTQLANRVSFCRQVERLLLERDSDGPAALFFIDVKTGEEQGGPIRLEAIAQVYASPVGAAGRIYITSLDGVTQVLSHGDDPPKTLAVNELDDRFSASAAIVGRQLPLRGERYLYCIEEK